MRPGPGRRAGFWQVCLIGSLAFHAALLLALGPAAPRIGSGSLAHSAKAMTVRALLLTTAPAPAPDLAPPAEVAPDEPAAPAAASAKALIPLLPTAGNADEAGYLPRRELDEPPKMLLHVNLFWPDDAPDRGYYKEVISLFINEAGVVQKVRFDGSALPESLQRVVRDAFMQAHFSPGRVKGFEVKSWIRMEVEFDTDAQAGNEPASH